MTAFTINGGATTNWDSLSGGSVNATLDSYAISNNTTLLIDTDGHVCANHSAAFGSLDTVTFSGVGGKLRIDGTNVRVIAYTGGSGNVPAIGTTISQGGVSATLLGVWASWQGENTASGSAMPASGFIKVKNKTGGNFAAGALTGITATASGADVVGWIEVRGADTAQITVPRIGRFEVVGDWFELGTTNGTRGQVLACPCTATVAGTFPGVWIETAAGSGVYERFTAVGSMVNLATNPTDERGKMVWQTTSGIRIGSDGTNNVGFLPPTGCKVRIPNVILTTCTRTAGSGSGPRVLPNATLATRQEFVTTNAGDIDLQGAVCQWYANFAQPFRVKIRDCAFNDTLVISEMSAPMDADNFIVSPTQAQLNFALNLVSNFGGGTMSNVQATRFSLAASGAYVNSVNFNKGITFNNVKSQTLLNRGNATTGCWTRTQNVDCVWTDCKNIGGKMLAVGDVRPSQSNTGYADNFSGTTGTGNPHYVIEATTGTSELTVDGMNFLGLTNVHPYNGLVSVTACYDTLVKNIGTFASPLSLGSANASGVIVNGGGNNDGITIKRVYTSNTRTGLWALVNSDNRFTAENVNGDYADTTVVPALNAIVKGCGLTGATTGQVSVYGTHWADRFTSTTAGMIEIFCNEPTADSASQCAITAGTPKFNSAGQVALTTVGDQVTWTVPYEIKGHTALANLAPTLTGTNTGNLTYEYQIDTGSGFSAWKTLNAANLNGETISASDGFLLKVRATCATANAGNLLTNIRITTVTTSTAQSTNQYPLNLVDINIAAQVALTGAEVRIYDLDNNPAGSLGSELAGTESNVTSDFAFAAEAGNDVWLQVMQSGYEEYGQQITVPAAAATINIILSADNNA